MAMTDVTGYRADGGSLGQDQGVGPQLRKILTSKLPLLNSPGTVIENSLYYDVTSSSVSAVEMQETFAKDRIVFNNLAMGTSPSVYIPSVLFANTVYWTVQLPDIKYPNTAATQDVYFYAPHGWLFYALRSIIVYMGSSNIAQIEIDGFTNFLINMAVCETKTKRQRMLSMAGSYLNNRDPNSIMWNITNDGANALVPYLRNSTIFLDGRSDDNWPAAIPKSANNLPIYYPMSQAVVPIRLPFSSSAALEKKLSFDTKLSTQPIQVTISTRPQNDIFLVGPQLVQTSSGNWSQSSLQLWQEELSDKSLSVRNELLAMPEYNVGYPFQYAQSIPFTVPVNQGQNGNITLAPTSATTILMNLTSIINSDLTTFLFMISSQQKTTTAVIPTAAGGASNLQQFSPLYGEKISNILLLLNGQRFFAFDEMIYEGVTLSKQLDEPFVDVVIPIINGDDDMHQNIQPNGIANSVSPMTNGAQPFPSHYYEFNNSRLRSIVAESHMQNTARFTNQTFQLSFTVERTSAPAPGPYAWGNSNDPTSVNPVFINCTLFMSYLYNGVILVGGDGGTTKLVTN